MLLHRLKQGGLRARAGAVDLIRHQKLREDRATHEAEMTPAIRRFLQNFRAGNVGRHQIRCELHAPRIETEHGPRVSLDELRLGEARDAYEQTMATCENGPSG